MQTLEELADLTGSTFKGDKNTKIYSVSSLHDANEGQISFVSHSKYIDKLALTNASVVILSSKLAEDYKGNVLINNDPYLTYARVLNVLHAETNTEKSDGVTVHESAVIHEKAQIHHSARIGPNVVIESGVIIGENAIIDAGCFIGKNTQIAKNVHVNPNVTINSETLIGSESIIHSGAVIGADGFGFAPQKDKTWFKIRQIGNVVIGENVEIGANTTVDRAALGSTNIGTGVKLDNQIQIGHNVHIGEHTAIAAGALIAGSTHIGKHCQIAGAVAIAGHLTLTDDVIVTGKSTVIKSINKAGVYSSGTTAEKNEKWRRNSARFRSLDEMAKKIQQLEKKLKEK